MTAGSFTPARLQSLCRLAGYTLLFEYLLLLFVGVLPLTRSPERLLGLVAAILDTSSLPLLALPLLFAGFSRDVRPARWEWAFARSMRGLLLVVAVLYILLIPATISLGSSIQASGDLELQMRDRFTTRQFQDYRRQLTRVERSDDLKQLLLAQPQIRSLIGGSDSPLSPSFPTLEQQKRQALRLVDRLSTNSTQQFLLQRSNASGELVKQQFRLILLALVHSLYFSLGSLAWPSRLPSASTQSRTEDDESA